jgi:hypothetical protein
METQTRQTTRMLIAFCGVVSLVPCVFFAWYSVRLLYVNLTMTPDEAAAHRTGGMLIGAVAFPIATLIFGAVSWFLWRWFRRS